MPEDRFLVIKREDIEKYLPLKDKLELGGILRQIRDGREKDGKSNYNFYAVINTNEPYFAEVKSIMQKYGHWED